MSPTTRCAVLKQAGKSEGRFPSSLELLSWNRLHKNTVLVTKRVAVAPFEPKIGPNESYGRAASVGTPPGAKKTQIRAKILVKLPIHRPGGRYVISSSFSSRARAQAGPAYIEAVLLQNRLMVAKSSKRVGVLLVSKKDSLMH